MSKTINTKILLRRDTSTNWSTNNPILSAGEVGFAIDIGKHKIGDGVNYWNDLPYFALVSDITNSVYIEEMQPNNASVGDVWWVVEDNIFNITYNLTDVVSSNTANSMLQGSNYTTTLSTEKVLSSVSVLMDNIDITSTVYDNTTNIININNLTGDIIITASASDI